MTTVVLDGAGWLGGVTVAIAYVLVSAQRLPATGRTFQVLNVVGGALLTVTAIHRGALPNMIINLVWIGFGLYALATFRRTERPAAVEGVGASGVRQG